MSNKISSWFNTSIFKSKRAYIAIATLFALNIFFSYETFFLDNSDPLYSIGFLLISLSAALVICMFIVSKQDLVIFSPIRKSKKRISKLKKRIIIAFTIGAALPTIIVAIFSTYFFNYGIETWFDKKISNVLDQSIVVGESYVSENTSQLKETAISVADDLNSMYYELIHNSDYFSEFLNAQAELRSINEGIVFQRSSNTILAQTNLSFSLSFAYIPHHIIEQADKGAPVQISSDPNKIRILIKLRDYNDTYLLIGKLIDAKIIDHIDKANGTAQEYFSLKKKISDMQVKFSIVFILLSIVLSLIAIIWGRIFAERIVKPIRELVIASERVKDGDLLIQVPLKGMKKDEIQVLSSSFNRMVNQLDRQQKDLIIAQRAHAWSDVARRVAHEIKNPLTPMKLSAEILLKKYQKESSEPETFKKYVNNILKNTDDIKLIVQEFVDFARLPAPSFSKCEIISLIHDLVESRKMINDNIHYGFNPNIESLEFICDISQINRMMVNLLQNSEEAFKNSDSDKKINIELYSDKFNLKIIIIDNGPGFTQEFLESTEQLYVTTKSHGTGLGLAIVKRIALDHYGKLKLSNNEPNGARIELTFDMVELRNKLK